MSEWLIALEGTEAGHQLALGLAILAAFLHAVFGALQKGGMTRGFARADRRGVWAMAMRLRFCRAVARAAYVDHFRGRVCHSYGV